MHLKISQKICPLRLAMTLFPDQNNEDFDYDSENIYEWVILPFPEFKLSLNISRDHGQHELENDTLDSMTDHDFEHLEYAGFTYITNNKNDRDIPDSLIQKIANQLRFPLNVYHKPININKEDGQPDHIISPS